jgi:glucokinase
MSQANVGAEPSAGPTGELILAGDVGGTHARLALFEAAPQGLRRLDRQAYESARHDGLGEIVTRYLRSQPVASIGGSPTRACLALAAPRDGDRWRFPNLDWTVERDALREQTGLKTLVLCNDFDAVAHSIDRLDPNDLTELRPGRAAARAPRAFLGAGTGLGVAFSVWSDGRHRVVSSEGGHVDFAPRSERERKLLSFLQERHDHVSYERVLSGSGIEAIYRSLTQDRSPAESEAVLRRFESEDPAAVVSELGLKGEDPLCVEALDVFASVYGAQAGNLALLVEARGGVYIAGGIAPRILEKLRDGRFVRSFEDKGRVSDLLAQIPVYVVTREDVGLLGAAVVALEDDGVHP